MKIYRTFEACLRLDLVKAIDDNFIENIRNIAQYSAI